MRIASLPLDLSLLLLALVALLHTQGTTASPANDCPTNDCVSSEKCEWPIVKGVCGRSGDVCCSLLKSEYRTECRHHGGECMDHCNEQLTRRTTDCPANKKCCVLV